MSTDRHTDDAAVRVLTASAAVQRVPDLRRAGTGMVPVRRGTGLPSILHWGAALGDLGGEQRQALAAQVAPATPSGAVHPPSVGRPDRERTS